MRLRRAVRARFGAENWERLKQRCEHPAVLARTLRHRLARVRLRRSRATAPGRREAVLVRGRTRVAVVRRDLTPLRAREHNLQLVCGALRYAGVDHFVVRAATDTGSAVAVSAADRPAAEIALRAACTRTPAYLTLSGGSGSASSSGSGNNRAILHGGSTAAWRRAARHSVIRVSCYQTDPSTTLVLGPSHGCDLEVWDVDGEDLRGPRPNRACDRVPRVAPTLWKGGHHFTRLASAHTPTPLGHVPTREEFTGLLPDDVRFPVDAVYTWVDGDDLDWQRRRARVACEPYHPEAANAARYLNRDELRYSLRSLHLYAPWLRHVYLVTDQQVPHWLAHAHPRLTVVDHRELFADPSSLPTFNSHAIESQLHHIEGLSEHFLYFNDDVFLGSPVTPQHFFHASGLTKFFPSKALLPHGNVDLGDVPVAAAAKNNRRLLATRFGSTITRKMKHTPCALRRSVLQEIEREFPDDHRRTATSAIRGQNDLSIPTSLHHYYAFHTGRAVPGTLRYDYVDLSRPGAAPRLNRLLATRAVDTFCLNDTVSAAEGARTPPALVRAFLDSYFPLPSPFEASLRRPSVAEGADARHAVPGGDAYPPAEQTSTVQAAAQLERR